MSTNCLVQVLNVLIPRPLPAEFHGMCHTNAEPDVIIASARANIILCSHCQSLYTFMLSCHIIYVQMTPLHRAEKLGIVKLLIENGADIDARAYDGVRPFSVYVLKLPPLMLAMRRMHISIKLLCKFYNHGMHSMLCKTTPPPPPPPPPPSSDFSSTASIYCTCIQQTPLHMVSDLEIAKTLVENGADVNARDEFEVCMYVCVFMYR